MTDINFMDLDSSYSNLPGGTPKELMGMYPLGGGGLIEAPYRHFFECRHLKKIVQFKPNMQILELGSGNGRWALSLAPLVNQYTGVDICSSAIKIAQQETHKHGIKNVDFHEQSVLDFQGAHPYDFVYFSSVTQYLEDSQIHNMLNRLTRWIKPGASIVDRSTINNGIRETIKSENYFSVLRTPKELINIYESHGFTFKYSKRSYRFLRCAKFINRKPLKHILLPAVRKTQPLSLYAMQFGSFLVDIVFPISSKSRSWSHDFFLFVKGANS
jgi:2-polyprenyl-3-methyl-5-hydroxy-6-metoxy-1,4-benzoquinol methylase